jgi:hypothetical protein
VGAPFLMPGVATALPDATGRLGDERATGNLAIRFSLGIINGG